MLKEEFVKFNFNRLLKYNEKLKKRHEENEKKIANLKTEYLKKARDLEKENKKIIFEKDSIIEELRFQIDRLKREREGYEKELDQIPSEIVSNYNNK
ncbi:MAG: hypothetical protein IJK18_04135 [Clostridia bacterium]|nr:hypothetical protein [Clostridia bacterium]